MLCNWFKHTSQKWLAQNNIETEVDIDTIPNGKMYYTNFELMKMDWFKHNKNYQAFVKFVDENGWIFSRRYGDAPLRYLTLNLFEKQEKIGHVHSFCYQHGGIFHC